MRLRRILNQKNIVVTFVVLCMHCLLVFWISCHYPSIKHISMMMSKTDRKGIADCGSRGGAGEFGKE